MTWLVQLVGAQPQEFVDLQDIGGQYYQLKRELLNKLRGLAGQVPDYYLRTDAIQWAKGSKDALKTPFVLLVVTSAGLAVTFLGNTTSRGDGRIVGVWPAQFRGVLQTDREAIPNLLYIAAERPEAVRHLELLF